MKKRGRILLAGSLIASLAWISWELLWPHEMVYRGKPVSVWVKLCCLEPSGQPRLEVVSNLIDLGTNSLPAILRIAATHDSAIKKLLLMVPVPEAVLKMFKAKDAYARWRTAASDNPPMAVRAFILMGIHYDHRIAVPGLVQLLTTSDNPKSRLAALSMLNYIADSASNAVPALTLALQDQDTEVQILANHVLTAVTEGRSNELLERGGSRAAGAARTYSVATPAGSTGAAHTFTNSEPK